jgi:hypothetical protein
VTRRQTAPPEPHAVASATLPRAIHGRYAVIGRLAPPPDFILFAGDEIAGMTASTNSAHNGGTGWNRGWAGSVERRSRFGTQPAITPPTIR